MTSEKEELKHRVEAKRKRLEAKLEEVQADAQSEYREQEARIKDRLFELQEILSKGWDDVTEEVSGRLNDWLKRS